MELTMLEKLEQMRVFLETEVAAQPVPTVETQVVRLLLEWAVEVEKQVQVATQHWNALRELSEEVSAEETSASTPSPPSSK